MYLIVGLGNPGKRFENTRHNTGFVVLDFLQKKFGLGNWQASIRAESLYLNTTVAQNKILLVKPQTFMNNSGISVKGFIDTYKNKSEEIVVVFDDLDIALGEYKIQKGKGPKDHNGLLSIYEKTGINDFWHVRIGINNPDTRVTDSGTKIPGEKYVLMNFIDDEMDIIERVIKDVIEDLSIKLLFGDI